MKTVVRISGILIMHDGIMLVKCDGIDDYLLPGGKLEPGESDLDALRRELMEELNVIPTEPEFFGEYERIGYPPEAVERYRVRVRAYFTGFDGEPVPDRDEVLEIAWASMADLESGRYQLNPILRNHILPELKRQKKLCFPPVPTQSTSIAHTTKDPETLFQPPYRASGQSVK